MAINLNSGANLPRIELHFHWSLCRYSLSLCRPDVPRLSRLSFPRINVCTTAHERQHTKIDCMQISQDEHNNESSSLCQGAAPKGPATDSAKPMFLLLSQPDKRFAMELR
jgi:hypothetical protein